MIALHFRIFSYITELLHQLLLCFKGFCLIAHLSSGVHDITFIIHADNSDDVVTSSNYDLITHFTLANIAAHLYIYLNYW